MSRMASWGTIGKTISDAKTISEALQISGLDYNVKKCNLYTTLSDKNISFSNAIKFPNTVATVNESTGEILGIVGKNYEVCNNRDAFDFINYIDSDIKFVKAGQTHNGLVYVIARLEEMNILGDKFVPHVVFQNGHNGGISIKAAICPLRIVCQNQFNLAFRESSNTVSIRHTSTMQNKLLDARSVLTSTAEYMKTLNTEAEKYAGVKMSDKQISEVIEILFPIKPEMSVRTINKIEDNRSRLIRAYNEEDNANFRNTMWGLINAGSDYFTHMKPSRKSTNHDENHFMYVTFNPNFLMNLVQIAKSVTV